MTDKPEAYKAIIRFDLAAIETEDDGGRLLLRECVQLDDNRINVLAKRLAIENWLEERNVLPDAYCIYNNSCHIAGRGELQVSMTDRTTAIMLKLSFPA